MASILAHQARYRIFSRDVSWLIRRSVGESNKCLSATSVTSLKPPYDISSPKSFHEDHTRDNHRNLSSQTQSVFEGTPLPALTRPDLVNYCPGSNITFNEKIMKLAETRPVYHFGFGVTPFPVISCMEKALKEHAMENAYLAVAGIPQLREAICAFHERYDKLPGLHPDRIVVGPGTKELIFLAMLVFNGDILYVSPCWTSYKPQSTLAHQRAFAVVNSMENDWKITPEDVEKTITENGLTENKLLIMCNPDNPTGACYTEDELIALSEVFRKHNVVVLSDEIYARLKYDQDHKTLATFYPEGTIVSASVSKWASAGGWRLGYNIYPPELKSLNAEVHRAAGHTYTCAAAPIQYAVTKGLNNVDECQDYILHTCRILRQIGTFVHRELTSVGVMSTMPAAAYHIFPNFENLRGALKKRGIHTGQQMCDTILEECSVALMAGGPSFFRPLDELTTRLCYVNFDGKPSLELSMELGLDKPLPDDLVERFARPVYDGTLALKNWYLKQLENS